MSEAVIVAYAPERRSAGRTRARSSTAGPTILSGLVIKAAGARPGPRSLDPGTRRGRDLVGCGQPAWVRREPTLPAPSRCSRASTPGVTVNRYCSSSLQTIRMGCPRDIKADEGDVFVAGGVETVSRLP